MFKIGFVGLGIMGKPMAINLLKAGNELFVFDLNQHNVNEVKKQGATGCTSAKEVAEKSDVIISIVPDSPQVEAVCLAEYGIIHGLREGMLYIDMSTIAATTEIKINALFAEKGVATLDAPVSGGQPGAENGTLSIMVGGEPIDFERAYPVFEILGQNINHIGPIGAGQITKSCNQIATALATQGVIEALTLAKKAGLDPVKVRKAMLGGFAQSKALEISGQKMIDRDFAPGFKVNLYRKDLNIALQTAKELSVPLPGAGLLAAEMDALIANGKSELDFSAIIQIVELLAGVK